MKPVEFVFVLCLNVTAERRKKEETEKREVVDQMMDMPKPHNPGFLNRIFGEVTI